MANKAILAGLFGMMGAFNKRFSSPRGEDINIPIDSEGIKTDSLRKKQLEGDNRISKKKLKRMKGKKNRKNRGGKR